MGWNSEFYGDVCGWKLRAILGCLWLEVTCCIGILWLEITCQIGMSVVGNYVPHWDVCGWNLRTVLGCLCLEVTCCIGTYVVGINVPYCNVCANITAEI